MAFRRQDIPKTTRKTDDGGPRRIYPRFLRDRAILPEGRDRDRLPRRHGRAAARRSLAGYPCSISSATPNWRAACSPASPSSYRYRTPEFAEVIGEERALALAAWDILSPADLRAHVYLAANAEPRRVRRRRRAAGVPGRGRRGARARAPRSSTSCSTSTPSGTRSSSASVPRPRAEDVVARYNVHPLPLRPPPRLGGHARTAGVARLDRRGRLRPARGRVPPDRTGGGAAAGAAERGRHLERLRRPRRPLRRPTPGARPPSPVRRGEGPLRRADAALRDRRQGGRPSCGPSCGPSPVRTGSWARPGWRTRSPPTAAAPATWAAGSCGAGRSRSWSTAPWRCRS